MLNKISCLDSVVHETHFYLRKHEISLKKKYVYKSHKLRSSLNDKS